MAHPVTVLLFSSLSMAAVITTPIDSSSQKKFGVLLDIGSSSTKLKVYSWGHPAENSGIPKVTLAGKGKSKPGLASLNAAEMASDISTLLTKAQELVEKENGDVGTTPIYAMATAGFRLIGLEIAEQAMTELNAILSDSTINPFLFKEGDASVLSGEEEGVYAWLAVNYLNGFFNTEQPDPSDAAGLLELGGGSTQIAFIPRDPLMAEEFQVTVGGQRYSLYVQSYLKYGSDQIEKKVAAFFDNMGCVGAKVENPCYLHGDEKNLTLDGGQEVWMIGTADPVKCREAFKEILAPAPPEKCNLPPCAIGSVFQPPVTDIDFYAISAFYYPVKGVGAIKDDETLDLPHLWEKAGQFCRQDISTFSNPAWASSDCLGAIYIYSLFTGPYGFAEDTQQITLAKEIDEKSIEWALGAMLEMLSLSFTGNPEHCSTKRK